MSECTAKCAEPVKCTVCRQTKAPNGRDVAPAAAGGYCDRDCPGYREDPQPGHLWPNEWPPEGAGDE